jgi:hypothetical protein
MRTSTSYLLSMLLAGALPGCHPQQPAASVSQTVAAAPENEREDARPVTYICEDTSIEEVEPLDAEAKLTVRVDIPQQGERDETFYLKKVVRQWTLRRHADGSYSASARAGRASKGHHFVACGGESGCSGWSMVASTSPERVTVSIHRSWSLAGGGKGETGGEIEVPWMGTSHKVFSDGTTFHAVFAAVDDPKQGSGDRLGLETEPSDGAESR